MKKILFILILTLILSGCTKPVDPLEGRSEKEIAACNVIQKFVVFYSADTTDISWVSCNFTDASSYFPDDDRWVAISPKPSEMHPNYENYIRNVEYREKNNIETPNTDLLIDVENDIIMDPNIADPEAGRFFRLIENDQFERPTKDELVEIYGEEILEM